MTLPRTAVALFLASHLSLSAGLCQQSSPSDPTTPATPKREVIRVNESRTNLLLFPTGEEVFYDALSPANTDVFLAGAAGTTLSIDNSRLVFHTGQLFLNSGKNILTVGTRLANIRLAPDTTAVLDIHPHKPLRIAILSGNSPAHIKIRERKSTEMLKTGEELYVSDTVLPAEQYKSSDPVAREDVSTERKSFDARKLLAWHVGEINKKEKLSGNKKALLDKLYPSANNPATPANPANDPWHVLAAGGSEFSLIPIGEGVIHLRSGELFVYASNYSIIETPLGEVHADKGSLVAVDTSNGNLRARPLTGPGDVTIMSGKNQVAVPPGEEVVISDHKPAKEDTNPLDGIARRNPTTRALDDKLSVTVTDFSILSLLVSADYLKPIKKPLWTSEKSALERLIQTAAAVETVTQSKGGYTGSARQNRRPHKPTPGQAI